MTDNGFITRCLAVGLAAALAAGCASSGPPAADSRPSAEKTSAAGQGGEEVPAEVSQALLPPASAGSPDERSTGREPRREAQRFDIDVDDMPARAFFMSLVRDTPHNVVVHPGVSGRISLTLGDVTVPEVLSTVREVYDYGIQRTATGYKITPATLQTRVFTVNYLALERKGRSETRVTSGSVSETGSEEGNGGSDGGNGGNGGGDSREVQVGSRIQTDSKSNFWRELESTLETLVGSAEGRRVIVSSESSLVVVRAMPEELRQVRSYLSSMQSNLNRQVVLEAKIVEVELSEGFESGINFGALHDESDGDSIFGGVVGGNNAIDDQESALAGNPLTITPGNVVDSFTSSAIGGTFALALNLNDFNAVIELLDSQGDVHVLSSPRVATVNNQKAIIKVGTDEFFVTDIESDQGTGGVAATGVISQDIELTPFFSGIALDVTPQINDDGEVIMHVHPSVSEVMDQTKQFTIAGQQQSVPLARSNIRESDSIVRAKSGQVVVIGGLMQERMEDEQLKTPILGDIPVLGHLFKQKRTSTVKSELVILLKPIVTDSDGEVWRDQIERSRQRLDSMEPGRRWPPGGLEP